ncbi:hypothetical protein ACFUOZ_09100 [Paenarthrobacter sp. NPDC057355]|uniref:hypothetical protein n=1 Tax=Paenarthrobacter sp. NPDC057355 TaxID=3346105 RepID=UPI003641DDCB
MKRGLASGALLLLLTPLLTGCIGDYAAAAECEDLAKKLSPPIGKASGSLPTIDRVGGDGTELPWCVMEFTTSKDYTPDDDQISALKALVDARMANWSTGILVTVHTGNNLSLKFHSPDS